MSSFNKIIDHLVNQQAKWAGMKEREIDLGHRRIQFWSNESQKPTLILLHAFAANCTYSWYLQLFQLSKRYNIVMPNLLYFGNSNSDLPEYDVLHQVEMLEDLVNHLELTTYTLMGASYGGVVAYEIAQRNPDQTKGLVLINTPLLKSEDETWSNVFDSIQIESKKDVLVPETYEELFQLYRRSRHRISVIPRIAFKSIFNSLYSTKIEERKMLVERMLETHVKIRENKMEFPIFLLWGEKDVLAPIAIAHQFKQLSNSEVHLIPFKRTGHMPNVERPLRFNRILKKIL